MSVDAKYHQLGVVLAATAVMAILLIPMIRLVRGTMPGHLDPLAFPDHQELADLARTISDGYRFDDRRYHLESAVFLLSAIDDPRVADILKFTATYREGRIRSFCRKLFAAIRESINSRKVAWREFRSIVEYEDEFLAARMWSAEALGWQSPDDHAACLVRIAHKQGEDEAVRAAAIRALSFARTADLVPKLLPLLKSPSENLRAETVSCLAEIGDASLVPAVLPLMRASPGSGASSGGRFSSQDPPSLNARVGAIAFLYRHADSSVVPALKPYVAEAKTDADLATAILKLLAKLDRAECAAAAVQLVREADHDSGLVAAKMLNAIGDEENFRRLKTLSQEPRHVMAEIALAMSGNEESRQFLLERLAAIADTTAAAEYEAEKSCRAIIGALEHMKSKEAVPILNRMIKNQRLDYYSLRQLASDTGWQLTEKYGLSDDYPWEKWRLDDLTP